MAEDPSDDAPVTPAAKLPADAPAATGRRGERRAPMAAAVLAAGVLHEFLPDRFLIGPRWAYPAFLAVVLVVLVVGDPGRIDRDRRWLRVTTGFLIGVITLVNAVNAVRLTRDIFDPHAFPNAAQLLATGAVIWATNIVAFALWFWDLDGGGAAARLRGSMMTGPAFVFPEMSHTEHVPAGWYPKLVDYLSLSWNTATSFSITDVSPVKRWAKLLMIAESAVSLALATLVVARAINML